MFRALISVFAFLSAYQLLTIARAQEEINEVNSTLVTYWCDEKILQDVEKHMVNQRSSIELDSETNKAWTIIQRRINGNVGFYRNWLEYEIGFGDLYGSCWLGLEKIHLLTNSKPHKLWIELRDFDGNIRNAYYNLFGIGDANTKYALNVLGEFSGNSGDALRYHAGHKFSTKTITISLMTETHARHYEEALGGLIIVKSGNNLNGEYLNGSLRLIDHGMGINWYSWLGRYSLKYVHMAIRPVD